MKREHIYLAVTAVSVAFAAAQLSGASATPRAAIKPGVLKPVPGLVADKPCAAGFATTTTKFSEKGHSYPCLQLATAQPKCKKGYYVSGKPHVVQWGNGWKIRYWCQSPPH